MRKTTAGLRETRVADQEHGFEGNGRGPGDPDTLRVAELGPRHLLVVARLRNGGPDCALLEDDGSRIGARLPTTTVEASSGLDTDATHWLVAGIVEADLADVPALTLVSGAEHHSIAPERLASSLTDLRTVLRDDLAGLDQEARSRLIRFLAESARSESDHGVLSRARGLALIRDALREPAAVRPRTAEEIQGLNIDALYAVDDRTFWIRGWMLDRDAPVTRLTAMSPEGHRAELLPGIYRAPRPDLEGVFGSVPPGLDDRDETGFVACFELSESSRLRNGWVVEIENAVGTRTEASAPPVVTDEEAVRNAILRSLSLDRVGDGELTSRHARPALDRLQKRTAGAARVRRVAEHGTIPGDPTASIIVPLYRRIDFLEQQLAHFAHDPELRDAELIYVLDSPERAAELEAQAPALHALYRVPFRVVYLERNLGFSGANNAGVAFAHAPQLLFLNSDVIPTGPGWLGRLLGAYDTTPDVGAMAPKLLYEDDSLQHAGLYFEQRPESGLWENAHYYKGLHRTLPAANVARRVPAVTGACLLVDAELYAEVGGFRGMYVQGDYEDSDLCLRVMEAGRSNWYVPEVELYHLEGQSYPDSLRRRASAYNMWLHTHLWGPTIESIMAEPTFNDLRGPIRRTA